MGKFTGLQDAVNAAKAWDLEIQEVTIDAQSFHSMLVSMAGMLLYAPGTVYAEVDPKTTEFLFNGAVKVKKGEATHKVGDA